MPCAHSYGKWFALPVHVCETAPAHTEAPGQSESVKQPLHVSGFPEQRSWPATTVLEPEPAKDEQSLFEAHEFAAHVPELVVHVALLGAVLLPPQSAFVAQVEGRCVQFGATHVPPLPQSAFVLQPQTEERQRTPFAQSESCTHVLREQLFVTPWQFQAGSALLLQSACVVHGTALQVPYFDVIEVGHVDP
jgi:hypothetical protein